MMARPPSVLIIALSLACARPSTSTAPDLGPAPADDGPPLAAPEPEPEPAPAPEPEPGGDATRSTLEAVMVNAVYTPNPDPAKLQQTKAAMIYKNAGTAKIGFCIETNGATSDVHSIMSFPDDPQVDEILRETIERWRFRPFMIDGKAIKACTSKTFHIKFK